MSKKSIGGIDESVKDAFDALQVKLGAGNANETLAAIIDGYSAGDLMAAFDDIEVAGVNEVKRIMTNAARQMVMVLSHRYDMQNEALAEKDSAIEALQDLISTKDAVAATRDEQLSAQAKELEDLRKKAASVDALTKVMQESDKAQMERFDAMAARFDKQLERYELELAAVRDENSALVAERDAAKSQVKELQAQIEQLQAQLVDGGKA